MVRLLSLTCPSTLIQRNTLVTLLLGPSVAMAFEPSLDGMAEPVNAPGAIASIQEAIAELLNLELHEQESLATGTRADGSLS